MKIACRFPYKTVFVVLSNIFDIFDVHPEPCGNDPRGPLPVISEVSRMNDRKKNGQLRV